MTIEEVLATVDALKPSTYDDNTKILWLSELDGRIFNDLILTHERDILFDEDGEEIEPATEFAGYSDSDYGTELLVPFPYDRVYREYIFAQIDYSNGETDRYVNSSLAFNEAYNDYVKFYNRTHKPLTHPLSL